MRLRDFSVNIVDMILFTDSVGIFCREWIIFDQDSGSVVRKKIVISFSSSLNSVVSSLFRRFLNFRICLFTGLFLIIFRFVNCCKIKVWSIRLRELYTDSIFFYQVFAVSAVFWKILICVFFILKCIKVRVSWLFFFYLERFSGSVAGGLGVGTGGVSVLCTCFYNFFDLKIFIIRNF